MSLANYLVTFSNVFAIPLVVNCLSSTNPIKYVFIMAPVASVMMHLTETKHGLPGICMQRYSSTFLNIDRGIAIASGLVLFHQWFTNKIVLNQQDITYGLIGLALNAISEIKSPVIFVPTHIAWHYIAYDTLNAAIKQLS